MIPFRPVRAIAAGLALFFGTVAWAGGTEEEVDLDALEAADPKAAPKPMVVTRVPEHDYDRKMLVFPAPSGPMSPNSSPRFTAKDTSLTAVIVPLA